MKNNNKNSGRNHPCPYGINSYKQNKVKRRTSSSSGGLIASATQDNKLNKLSIRDWPECERPRERLLSQGADTLSNAELLAIFIRTGTRGQSAIDIARELLRRYGNLRTLLDASESDLCQSKGLGPSKYAQLQASMELGRRYLKEQLQRQDALHNSLDTKRYLIARLRHRQQEIFACLFLNTQNQVISYQEIFHGTINQAPVFPREVVRRALKCNASSVIFAHNHPSGAGQPSQADKLVTQHLKQSLTIIDVDVLDHIIIGDSETYSFSEQGHL